MYDDGDDNDDGCDDDDGFCRMVNWRKALSIICSWDRCHRFSMSQISDMPRAGFEPVRNLGSDFIEQGCVVLITYTRRRQCNFSTNTITTYLQYIMVRIKEWS